MRPQGSTIARDRRGRRRAGGVLIYSIVLMVVLLAVATTAVDWGRAQLVKTELQGAADAAARQACVGLKTSTGQAQTNAVWAAGLNTADGSAVVMNPSLDVEFGTWDPATRTFDLLTGSDQKSATAVRVYARRTRSRSNPVPSTFARAFGLTGSDVTAVAIAARGNVVTTSVNARACPWLAGMPDGSTVAGYGGNNTPCTAPENSPGQLAGLSLVAGTSLMFRQTSGQTSYQDASTYGPDGNTSWIVRQNPVNGINATQAPLNALVGIFLDDRAPNTYAMAAEPDFSTAASRNFSSLSPPLKQVFFIGDGLDDSGNLQQFVVPAGATRLYLGIMDEKGWWWDNTGSLSTTTLDENISLVK
ncbi:MAG TPA: pilus assembly protein TadG-related protein [Humisphaera sp.]